MPRTHHSTTHAARFKSVKWRVRGSSPVSARHTFHQLLQNSSLQHRIFIQSAQQNTTTLFSLTFLSKKCFEIYLSVFDEVEETIYLQTFIFIFVKLLYFFRKATIIMRFRKVASQFSLLLVRKFTNFYQFISKVKSTSSMCDHLYPGANFKHRLTPSLFLV